MKRSTERRLARLEKLRRQESPPLADQPPLPQGDVAALWQRLPADQQLELDAAADAELREWQAERDRAGADYYARRETST